MNDYTESHPNVYTAIQKLATSSKFLKFYEKFGSFIQKNIME